MSQDSLDARYFNWLASQVADVRTRVKTRSYWSLLHQLSRTEFISFVPHDENRIEDAIDMRYEFLEECRAGRGEHDFLTAPCTMLELLIILSRELAFEMDDDVRHWFWHLLETIEIDRFNDHAYDAHAEEVIDEALDRVIHRRYKRSGEGGLFPLKRPERDQRKVELWYQLNAYLIEQEHL